MKLSYYTIEQAARSLECETDELEHFIFTGALKAQLYSNLKMFVVRRKVEGRHIGTGIAKYEGLVLVRESYLRQLLQKENVVIDSWLGLMQPVNIRTWYEHHGCNEDDFMKAIGISSWEPDKLKKVSEQSVIIAKPFPNERQNPFFLFSKALETFAENKGEKLELAAPVQERSYYYKEHGSFTRDNIRITHYDLEQFRQFQLEQNSQLEPAHVKNQLLWCKSKRRSTRVDPVIERLFRSNPKASAKILWSMLEHDMETDEPEFDIDQTVRVIEGLALEWNNTNNNVSELMFKTFSNKISELRKFYKSLDAK